MTTLNVHSLDTGNGYDKENLLDHRLEALLLRMDRIAASVEKEDSTRPI